MSQTRILHLLPDLKLGGGQQVLLRFLRASDRSRFQHAVAYFQPDRELESAFLAAGATLQSFPHRTAASIPGVLRDLCAWTESQNTALLHTNGTPWDKLYGQLVARRLALPHVTTLHGVLPSPPPFHRHPRTWSSTAMQRILRRAHHRLDGQTLSHAIAVSDAVRDSWKPWFASLTSPCEVSVVYSGVPCDEFRPLRDEERMNVRQSLGPNPDSFLILSVARLSRGKNLHRLMPLIQRLREHPRTPHLVLVGEGEERPRLEDSARHYGVEDRVTFLGKRHDVAQLMGASDLMIFPSASEGFGLVVLEGLACGLPVLASRLPSLRKLDHHGSGVSFVEPGNAQELLDQARTLMEQDSNQLRERGLSASARVRQEWPIEATANQYEEIYERCLAANATNSATDRRQKTSSL